MSVFACVEIGGGSIQTVLFANGDQRTLDGAHQPPDALLAIAAPGVIESGLVTYASNLGWRNADPVVELGLTGPALVLLNDAEAAALGEVALRGTDAPQRLVYVGVGTGIGGAVIRDRAVVRGNLFGHNANGHGGAFGTAECRCGRTGCLETVAAGWALPTPLASSDVGLVAKRIAYAIEQHPLAEHGTIALGGGIARNYPALVEAIASLLPHRDVEPSAAPADVKSAAPWGLRDALVRSSSFGAAR
jgi:predicted NBD/HSP70 family sugar kinase